MIDFRTKLKVKSHDKDAGQFGYRQFHALPFGPFTLSIQAAWGLYCQPKLTLNDYLVYSQWEVCLMEGGKDLCLSIDPRFKGISGTKGWGDQSGAYIPTMVVQAVFNRVRDIFVLSDPPKTLPPEPNWGPSPFLTKHNIDAKGHAVDCPACIELVKNSSFGPPKPQDPNPYKKIKLKFNSDMVEIANAKLKNGSVLDVDYSAMEAKTLAAEKHQQDKLINFGLIYGKHGKLNPLPKEGFPNMETFAKAASSIPYNDMVSFQELLKTPVYSPLGTTYTVAAGGDGGGPLANGSAVTLSSQPDEPPLDALKKMFEGLQVDKKLNHWADYGNLYFGVSPMKPLNFIPLTFDVPPADPAHPVKFVTVDSFPTMTPGGGLPLHYKKQVAKYEPHKSDCPMCNHEAKVAAKPLTKIKLNGTDGSGKSFGCPSGPPGKQGQPGIGKPKKQNKKKVPSKKRK